MSEKFSVIFCLLLISAWMVLTATLAYCQPGPAVTSCHPTPSSDANHYIVGYGSLMETTSKARTYKETGDNIPVQVTGFRREWNLKGEKTGATFLGVVVEPKSSFNGVIFQLLPSPRNPNAVTDAIKQYDKRERLYCRYQVDSKFIKRLDARAVTPRPASNVEDVLGQQQDQSPNLDRNPKPKKNEYWIYVNKPENVDPPAAKFPILKSYSDVFITGCLELEEKFSLKNFARNCVTSTKKWSAVYSMNDRLAPRYPAVNRYTPAKIDAVFRGIRLE